ncbi:heterokaryon incompatibility het-6 [Fusarium pseudocircinatum]|uniref:Heterokaryon incompatibility het-6 n=1 Tax=Fusarium pseudocircinatum TaxID=56676 RepID=A0A8H5PH76_9HYPO|nr:heterokaryon incompatibility het-6 [Fusarium pseudocircinatum]
MDNWHTTQCTKPDIAVFPGLNVPACMNCGEVCPSHREDNKRNDELQIPSAGRRSAMKLKWPPSMSYQNYAYSDDPDGSLHKSLDSLVDQDWCDKETDKHRSCSSVIKTAQTPCLQASKTSYEPLDGTKIRILRLHKGYFGGCLHGDFENVSLQNRDTESDEPETTTSDTRENATLYEAVSYTWAKGNGKREKDHAIFIGNRWDILPITENCYDALQNCRFDDRDRHLWVDAICINQSNISERTHQVGMMRRIYSTASRVLIYLGMDDAGSGLELTHDPEILSENPYFSRIWVVQEIASAKEALVLYRCQAMGWSFFHRNLQGLSSKRWMRHFGSPRQIDDARDFLTLLGDTRNCNASDPRDKIFALLGLWKKLVEPDYTLSPQAVYTGLASILITDESWKVVAQLLDMASHGRSMPGLPSWVPDWSKKSQRSYPKWRSRFPFRSLRVPRSNDAGKFQVHGQTGSLCILAAEIDIMAPYVFRGFRSIADGVITVDAGYFQVSLTPQVLQICEPTDSIFCIFPDKFCLILRKKADPNVYTFIGICRYSRSQNNQQELDAIRYLLDWAWLLSLEQKQPWSEFSTWTKIQVCWLALRKQKKLETRLFLKRAVRKVQFLQKMRNLAKAQKAVSNHSRDKELLKDFFKRQWKTAYKRWQQEDELLVVNHKASRALVRTLLPGYRSLKPIQDTATQYPLRQSMWLPLSSGWFRRESQTGKPPAVVTEYQLLATCVSWNIPLPPLHLIKDKVRHITLCLELGLEKGLQQLQRLALEHFPQDAAAHEKPLDSYDLGISLQNNFREEEWGIFLHWLSRPRSPSYDMLKHGSRMDVPLVWEEGPKTKTELSQAHFWLDDNFSRYVTALSGTKSSIEEVFALIYREQFELLWLFLFRSVSGFRVVFGNEFGAQIARCLFWRFDRSIESAYRVIGKGHLTHEETKELWTKFLDWFTQERFEEPAREIPSEVYVSWPRLLDDEGISSDNAANHCLEKIKSEGLLIVPPTQANPLEGSMPKSFSSDPQSQTLYGKPDLPELVQSEIWRRRLPERVFAFLFDDTETTTQSTQSDDNSLEELLAHGQPYNCGGPSVQDWRQEIASWNAVEQYISKSEWHMNCIKMDFLRGSKEEEDVYKGIVIV